MVAIHVEVQRSLRQRLPVSRGGRYWLPKAHGAGYAARACIGSKRDSSGQSIGRRCVYAESRTPTGAFKAAVKKLLRKTK